MHAQTMRADARGCLNVRAKIRYAPIFDSTPTCTPIASALSSFKYAPVPLPPARAIFVLHMAEIADFPTISPSPCGSAFRPPGRPLPPHFLH